MLSRYIASKDLHLHYMEKSFVQTHYVPYCIYFLESQLFNPNFLYIFNIHSNSGVNGENDLHW